MHHIIEISHIKKSYKSRRRVTTILEDVSFTVKPGQTYGFLGANGVGKTTLLKCIFHFQKPDSGVIKLFGEENYYTQEIFQRIGYAPEQTFLYPFLRGRELLDYMGRLAWVTSAVIRTRSDALMTMFGLDFAGDRRISAYSKGMKQRLSLAASLINDPELIFWDEPMSGLDPLGRNLVKDVMRDLKKQGKTILFNTHILSDVQEIADEYAILHGWKIVSQGNPREVDGSLEDFFTQTVRGLDAKVKVQ
jgi:ABC-2 type transport system ATP-binding protein